MQGPWLAARRVMVAQRTSRHSLLRSLPGQRHLTQVGFKTQKDSPVPRGPAHLQVVRYLQPFFFRMFPRMTSALHKRRSPV